MLDRALTEHGVGYSIVYYGECSNECTFVLWQGTQQNVDKRRRRCVCVCAFCVDGGATSKMTTSASAPTSASTNRGAAAGGEAAAAAVGEAAAAVGAASSNLRCITLNVIYKLRTTRLKTAQQLANELAKECAAARSCAAGGGFVRDGGGGARNLRRRVYDALQVLRALQAAAVAGWWARWDAASSTRNDGHTELVVLRRLTTLARARVVRKQRCARQLRRVTAAVALVTERNRRRGDGGGGGGAQARRRVHMPFALLRCSRSTELRAECSRDGRWLRIALSAPFQLVSDVALMMRLLCVSG